MTRSFFEGKFRCEYGLGWEIGISVTQANESSLVLLTMVATRPPTGQL